MCQKAKPRGAGLRWELSGGQLPPGGTIVTAMAQLPDVHVQPLPAPANGFLFWIFR